MKHLLTVILMLGLCSNAYALPRTIESTLNWWEVRYSNLQEWPTNPFEDIKVIVRKKKGDFYWLGSKCQFESTLICRVQQKDVCPLSRVLRVFPKSRRVTLGDNYDCKDGLFTVKRSGSY